MLPVESFLPVIQAGPLNDSYLLNPPASWAARLSLPGMGWFTPGQPRFFPFHAVRSESQPLPKALCQIR